MDGGLIIMENVLENPFYTLMEHGTPYEDYIDKIKETYNFKYYSKYIYEAKAVNWDIDNSFITQSQVRIIYSALLELFIEDGTPETFYYLYSNYVKMVMERNTNPIFRDGFMNSIFHYDAVQGFGRFEAYEKIQKIYNEDTKISLGIDTDIFDKSILLDSNLQEVTTLDIINANS